MAYNKTIWQNGVTPINEDNLNKIENELETLDGDVTTLNTDVETLDNNKANISDLSTVATSGNYEDLTNKPIGDIHYPTYTNGGDISSSIKTYYQKIGNRVFVNLNATETISANQYLQVFTLPEGYRPSIEVYNSAVRRGYNSIHQVYVNNNGVVGLFSNSAVTDGNFSGEISFIVAEEG